MAPRTFFEFEDVPLPAGEQLGSATSDGKLDTFLGPRRCISIGAASIDQPTWPTTPSSTPPVDVLNTAITDPASLNTTSVKSDLANVVANIGLTMPNTAGQINAVLLNATASKTPGTPGSIAGQLITGTDQGPTANLPIAGVMKAGLPIYFGEKTPSGASWSRASVLASKVKLTTG